MTRNPLFQKAVLRLAHPASLLALAALALNDFVLKNAAPSWLTGKLSDFALLFCLPFLTLALVAPLIPARARRLAPAVVFAALAGAFALVKTIPSIGAALHQASALLGLPLYTRPDPTDLLALVVFIPAWRLWRQPLPPARPRLARIVLPLAALLTLADMSAPDNGIRCFALDQNQVVALAAYDPQYISTDGGLTWQPGDAHVDFSGCARDSQENHARMSDPGGALQYRFQPGGAIERSSDGGQTWTVEYTPQHLNQVRKAYALKKLPSMVSYTRGPLAALEDPTSGNLLFAMGIEGVLVRTPAGQWIWAEVGRYAYHPDQRVPLAGYPALLWGEGLLALAAVGFSFSTLALRWHTRRGLRIVKVALGWLGWLATLIVLAPALTAGGYSDTILGTAFAIMGVYLLGALVDDLIALLRRRPAGGLGAEALFSLLAGLLFLLPLVLWAAEILPSYQLAAVVAVVLLAGALALRCLRRPVAGEGAGEPA